MELVPSNPLILGACHFERMLRKYWLGKRRKSKLLRGISVGGQRRLRVPEPVRIGATLAKTADIRAAELGSYM